MASELTEGFPCRFAPSASRFFRMAWRSSRARWRFALNGEVSKEPMLLPRCLRWTPLTAVVERGAELAKFLS